MSSEELVSLEGLHFLVVDDQEFIRHIVREALTATGVREIHTAINGQEALELIRARVAERADIEPGQDAGPVKPGTINRKYGGFDCVITDFNMHPLTGLHVLKAIRTGESGAVRDTPVTVLTGHSDDHLVASALALDANAFVVKPVSRIALLTRVVRAMKRAVDLKSAAHYAREPIPGPISSTTLRTGKGAGVSPAVILKKPKTRKPAQAHPVAAEKNAVCVPLIEIREGSTLLTDVTSASGTVMLARGTRMTPMLLDKLLDIKDLTGISDSVWIQP